MKLADKVTAELLDLITVQKRYLPGDKLPNEKELALQLDVSRTTIRESLQYLVSQNILEVRRGRGTFVREASATEQDFGFDQLNVMHLKIRDLYEIRLMLEPQMAYYAALRSTDEELQEIMRLEEHLEEVNALKGEDSEGNRQFHNAIARATHNEFGIRLMEITNDALIRAFAESDLKQVIYRDSILDHQLITKYMAMRDGEGARQAMYLHMKHSIQDYGLDEEDK